MARGTVKSFSPKHGYGFILPAVGDEQVYFHYTELMMQGYKCIDEGTPVEYDECRGPRGLFARRVCRVPVNRIPPGGSVQFKYPKPAVE